MKNEIENIGPDLNKGEKGFEKNCNKNSWTNKKIFEETTVVNVSGEKRCRISRTLAKIWKQPNYRLWKRNI